MFAEFIYKNFPYVLVKLNSTIEDDDDFEAFTAEWLSIYNRQKNFEFIFDARRVGWIPIKYAFKMSTFISNLKELNNTSLKRSVMISDSSFVKAILGLIFTIQSPVAPVYIVSNLEELHQLLTAEMNEFKVYLPN